MPPPTIPRPPENEAGQNPVSLEQLVLATADDLRRIKKKEPPPGEAVMRFAECEIELAVKTTVAANGKLKFWIVEIGGSAGHEATSRIKLKFTAIGDQPVVAVVGVAPGTDAAVPKPPVRP